MPPVGRTSPRGPPVERIGFVVLAVTAALLVSGALDSGRAARRVAAVAVARRAEPVAGAYAIAYLRAWTRLPSGRRTTSRPRSPTRSYAPRHCRRPRAVLAGAGRRACRPPSAAARRRGPLERSRACGRRPDRLRVPRAGDRGLLAAHRGGRRTRLAGRLLRDPGRIPPRARGAVDPVVGRQPPPPGTAAAGQTPSGGRRRVPGRPILTPDRTGATRRCSARWPGPARQACAARQASARSAAPAPGLRAGTPCPARACRARAAEGPSRRRSRAP
ncbi:hypothetical protein SAMN05428944_1979 [Streptomyces sp. 1222.5]|nr:hypothetical protein BX260_6113 [Streptomyces sp. 5112.2]SEB95746.1 hypothetical protein SAMN05428944_1979 [Streptomyces sp. 1222.5]